MDSFDCVKLEVQRPGEIDELHLVVAGDGPSGGTYIGYLSPEWLDTFVGFNGAYLAVTQNDVELYLVFQTTNEVIDYDDHVNFHGDDDQKKKTMERRLLLSSFHPPVRHASE